MNDWNGEMENTEPVFLKGDNKLLNSDLKHT